jgi:hypothetical protein
VNVVPPLQIPTSTYLHMALAYYPGHELPILYDVALPPSAITGNGISPAKLRTCLAEKATSPSTHCLILENEALGCNITVHPGAAVDASSPSSSWLTSLPDLLSPLLPCNPPPITVHNVLIAIHRAVHSRLSYDDFNILDPSLQEAVLAAWHARSSAQDEIKRMDVLAATGFGTQVAGLSASSRSAETWKLHFSRDTSWSSSSPPMPVTRNVRGYLSL